MRIKNRCMTLSCFDDQKSNLLAIFQRLCFRLINLYRALIYRSSKVVVGCHDPNHYWISLPLFKYIIFIFFATDVTPINSFLRIANFFILPPNLKDKVQASMAGLLLTDVHGFERPTRNLNLKLYSVSKEFAISCFDHIYLKITDTLYLSGKVQSYSLPNTKISCLFCFPIGLQSK